MKKRLFLLLTTAGAVLLAPGVLLAVDLRADDPIPPVPPGKSLPPPLPATPAPAAPPNNNPPPQTSPSSPGTALQTGGKGGQRLQKLKQELGLTPAQVAKLKPILEKTHAEVQALRANTSLPAGQKRQKIRQIFTASMQQIRPILTPQQLQKWKQIREERHATANATSTT